jgi:hypothetical protein
MKPEPLAEQTRFATPKQGVATVGSQSICFGAMHKAVAVQTASEPLPFAPSVTQQI